MTRTYPAVLSSDFPVALVGGGPVSAEDLATVLPQVGQVVAADGGAATLLSAGHLPEAVIGDFDSFPKDLRARIPADRLHEVPEQDSTDFEKCLARIDAPIVLAIGVAGGRMDHLLAVFSVLARLPQRPCIIVGPEDIGLLAPPEIELDLSPDETVSIFPLGTVTAKSTGLLWPVDGLEFDPIDQIGTSNCSTGPVWLQCNAPRMLLLLSRNRLETAIDAVIRAPVWT